MYEIERFIRCGMQDIAFCLVVGLLVMGLGFIFRLMFDAMFRRW